MASNNVQIVIDVDAAAGTGQVRMLGQQFERMGREAESSKGRIREGLASVGTAFEGVIHKAGLFASGLAAAGVAVAGWQIKNFAVDVIKTGASFDKLKTSLDTITQGEGQEWFDRLNQWAMKMPVNTEQAIQSFIKMRAMGLKPSIDEMTTLVDTMSALGGNADVLDGIATALGQMATKGRVSQEEMLQLAERGVPAFEILREQMGLTSEQLGNIGKQGLDAGQVIQALLKGMEERFGGQSEKLQKMASGMFESLKGMWTEFKRMVSEAGLMDYLEDGLAELSATVDQLYQDGSLARWGKQTMETLGAAFKMLQSVIGAISWLTSGPIVKAVADVMNMGNEAANRAADLSFNAARETAAGALGIAPPNPDYQLPMPESAGATSTVNRTANFNGGINIAVPAGTAPQTPQDWNTITREYIVPAMEGMGYGS